MKIIGGCPKYIVNYLTIGIEFLETYATNLSSLVSTYDNMTGVNATGLAGDSYLWNFWDKVMSEVSSSCRPWSAPKWVGVVLGVGYSGMRKAVCKVKVEQLLVKIVGSS